MASARLGDTNPVPWIALITFFECENPTCFLVDLLQLFLDLLGYRPFGIDEQVGFLAVVLLDYSVDLSLDFFESLLILDVQHVVHVGFLDCHCQLSFWLDGKELHQHIASVVAFYNA